ncbi:MAG TPA: 2-succinyl-5-enolpyruvyl-6-hydroxy-3-cyclohexene-1-carboxylic-acid synthase [Lactococcus sp.]|uniref:2-succinyl-5-enolpyruvyl-6-hydroxy-3- cyclohexene-1-carboxylic-acid synthase n=1 Tax=Lactococcus TaxID=1357 RepID=UPI000E9D044E|nr:MULTISPECIES: 2-succinyl-5-enolpyruvyl-6-hydroxy-3-cyclohexene-1-carboxylic-acid synthase [Lactococcus]HAP15355.1 2-succinyl-5-enolpyruvyl-6-hydroxy-3-cyclohexene-1-carboxylic-acid synthase [Lactococcus sp.]HBC90550.1 2-succinyl-5-enolpyruvyl-6-hydroxy-3-cyclohexene-1-carboxylic-acid synthase [Lactococcus sp.]
MNNEYLAPLVDELYHLGVREAVFSPGSRSTALAMLFEEYGKYDTYVNIDERSAAFFALGIAKVQQRPVVLICTSGSAAAHYLPALTEAKHSRVPLILLTADRPNDLQFVGAAQTVNQSEYFGKFVNHYEELSRPTEHNFWTYPRKVAQRAFAAAVSIPSAAAHVNVPVSEPLIPDLNAENYRKGRKKFIISKGNIKPQSIPELSGNGIILAGPDSNSNYQEALITLSEKLQAPLLADPLSNLRKYEHPNIIDTYDAFLAHPQVLKELKVDFFLQFGQIPVSKHVLQLIAQNADAEYIQVDPALDYRNPSQTTTQLVQADVPAFCQEVPTLSSDNHYLKVWQKLQKKMRQKLQTVEGESAPFEGHYIQVLQALMPEKAQLLISNSMTIRNVDYFWRSQHSHVHLLGNRGTNGIDGQESTALGVSTNGVPTVLLTGDLSMLHDMNGLIVGKTQQLNLTIVLFNNDGGGIFHHLAQKGQPHFDYLFSTPHGLDFSGLARLIGLDYHLVVDYQDFEEHFRQSINSAGIHLLEIKTDKDVSLELHKKYTTYDI